VNDLTQPQITTLEYSSRVKPFESVGYALPYSSDDADGGYLEVDDVFARFRNTVRHAGDEVFWALASERQNHFDVFAIDRTHEWAITCPKELEPYLPHLLFNGYPTDMMDARNIEGIVALLEPALEAMHRFDRYLIHVNGRRWVRDDRDLGFVPLITESDFANRPSVKIIAPNHDYSLIGEAFGPWHATFSKTAGNVSYTADGFGPAVSQWTGWGSVHDPFTRIDEDYSRGEFATEHGLADGWGGGPGDLALLVWFAVTNRLSNFEFRLKQPFVTRDSDGNYSLTPSRAWANTWTVEFGDISTIDFVEFAREYEEFLLDS
jgi:hypothetical protein